MGGGGIVLREGKVINKEEEGTANGNKQQMTGLFSLGVETPAVITWRGVAVGCQDC